MIKNIQNEGNILIAEVSDMITKDDVESVIPIVEEMISKYKQIKCIMEISEMKGYTLDGFLADFGFYFKYKDAFSYMALVGDKKYKTRIMQFLNLFYPNKAEYFDNINDAKEWIQRV